jgi:mono/diheme cytochrome c family protein
LKTSVLAIAFWFLLFACTAAQSQSQSSDTGLSANPVFVKNCTKCHGKNAEGRHFRGPSLISGKVAAASDDDLRNIITNGKGHMPKFAGKRTSDEIDTLIQQIKAANNNK